MKVAGDERLGSDAAAGPDHFHREALVAVIAFFDGDEFVHVAGGDRGNGKPDLFFRVCRVGQLCRQPGGAEYER